MDINSCKTNSMLEDCNKIEYYYPRHEQWSKIPSSDTTAWHVKKINNKPTQHHVQSPAWCRWQLYCRVQKDQFSNKYILTIT